MIELNYSEQVVFRFNTAETNRAILVIALSMGNHWL